MPPRPLLLTHAAATLVLVGVILVVQLVHYPLFRGVGAAGFPAYAAEHGRRITWVVGPAMLVELGAAVALVVWRPPTAPAWAVWAGLALVGVVWASTALLQVPLHTALRGGLDAVRVDRLVATNWIRTAAWAVRGGLAVALLARAIPAPP